MKTRWAAPTRTTWWALGLAFATTVGTATYLASIYGTLPIGVPVRYIRGLPAIYQLKSPMLVGLPAVIQVGLLVLFGGVIMLLLWRARATVAGSDSSADADSIRMRLAAEGIALLAMVWIGVQALGAARLITLWRAGSGGFGRVYSLAMVAAIVVSIAIAYRTMKLVGSQRRSAARDDPAVWWLRSLYFNPRDPALFVASRRGVGWTLNFGRPLAIALLLVILLLGVGGPYYFVRYVLLAFSDDWME
jgi:uncharacterized membrane protein